MLTETKQNPVTETVHVFIPRPNLAILSRVGKTHDPFVCIGSFPFQKRDQILKGQSIYDSDLDDPAVIPKVVGKVKRAVRRIRKRGHAVMGAIAHEIRIGDSIFVGFSYCSSSEDRFNLKDGRARVRAITKLMDVMEQETGKPGWLQAVQLGILKVDPAELKMIAEKKVKRGRKKGGGIHPVLDRLHDGKSISPEPEKLMELMEVISTVLTNMTTGLGQSTERLEPKTGG